MSDEGYEKHAALESIAARLERALEQQLFFADEAQWCVKLLRKRIRQVRKGEWPESAGSMLPHVAAAVRLSKMQQPSTMTAVATENIYVGDQVSVVVEPDGSLVLMLASQADACPVEGKHACNGPCF